MGRIIIFTGKGGVGKTSIASAHALKASQNGMKTLIVSTDMAHNLKDIFMKDIGKEYSEIANNLYALEIDPNHEMNNNYGNMFKAFKNMMPETSLENENLLEDMVVFPGIEELFSLIKCQP